MTYPIFDSHCHLDAEAYDADRADVLQRAAAAGVDGVLVPATDLASCAQVLALLSDPPPGVALYGAVGVHPHSASELPSAEVAGIDALTPVREMAAHPRIHAIGETGLDYHYNFSPPAQQRAALRAHLRLACDLDLPIILHCREAEEDLLALLDEEGVPSRGGVVHCYSGTPATAEKLLALGLHLGFTGVITFKGAEALRAIVRTTPRDRLLLETDGPYLAPIPHRGHRNEPAYLPLVAEAAAALHQITPAELAAAAARNTRRLFNLPPSPPRRT